MENGYPEGVGAHTSARQSRAGLTRSHHRLQAPAIETGQRACPSCGRPAGEWSFCAACGATLVTIAGLGEAVPGPAAFASWGYRVGGGIIDFVLPWAVGFTIDAAGNSSDDAEAAAGLAVFAIWFLNWGVLAAVTNGRSVGKLVAGTRVVRESFKPFGFGIACLRDIVCRVFYAVPLVMLIDLFLPLGEKHQSLRDKIVHTRVMQEPSYRSRRWPLVLAAVAVLAWMVMALTYTDAFDEPQPAAIVDSGAPQTSSVTVGGSTA